MAILLIRAQLVSFVSQQCSIRSQRSVKRYYSYSIINSCHVHVQYIITIPRLCLYCYHSILELKLCLGGMAWLLKYAQTLDIGYHHILYSTTTKSIRSIVVYTIIIINTTSSIHLDSNSKSIYFSSN